MSGITTHVLDAVRGKPAAGIGVRLEVQDDGVWRLLGESKTNVDGRCRDLVNEPAAGVYRLTFATGSYLKSHRRTSIYPEIVVCFEFAGDEHYHLPLLLSDNSYTTNRGS